MRRLNILHTESSLGWGGQEIRIINESLGMLKRGHRVIIAAQPESKIIRRAQEIGLDVEAVTMKRAWSPASIFSILLIIKQYEVDILNTHSSRDSWIGTIAARLSRLKPFILRTRHLSTPIGRNPLSRLIYNILPDGVITTGDEIKQRMIKYNHFDGEKIFPIPTGVDIEHFNPVRVSASIHSKGFSIGMVSVLRSWKGHRYFIEAVPAILCVIPDSLFYIVGDGPQFQNIRDMIKESSLEDKVLMLGHRDDIPEILASLDVIVHPSYANEGVPQSILQAMAMEKPVVASDAGSIKDVIIDKETGFLIEPKNHEQLAEKVIELYKNPELRIKFGKEGRKLVEKDYSTEKMLDKIESLYERLLYRT
ncbi:MAG: glycosyltransferase family 4 protein [Nitrospirota bacterium]